MEKKELVDWNSIRTEVLVLKLDKKEKKGKEMRLQLCFFFWYVTVRFSLALILIRYGHQLTETCSFWSHARTFKRTANFNLDAFQWSISSIENFSTGREFFY